jgi:hypothetical protein
MTLLTHTVTHSYYYTAIIETYTSLLHYHSWTPVVIKTYSVLNAGERGWNTSVERINVGMGFSSNSCIAEQHHAKTQGVTKDTSRQCHCWVYFFRYLRQHE